MWGIRVIRVGVLVGGLLAMVAATGCCESCKHLWEGKKAVPTSQPTAPATGDDKDAEKVLSEWKRNDGGFKDRSHLTADRVQGGIY
jgi:hypothetical protein